LLEENRIAPVHQVDLVHTDTPHPFHLEHREEAARNWQVEISRTPQLFDGPVMLASTTELDGGVLSAMCHIVPFSTFLLWRARRPAPGAYHIFAMPMLVGSDDGILLGRMAATTANAGLFYSPSGSFDPDDVVDGRFDAGANMAREVKEETGLDLSDATPDETANIICINGAIVVFRRFHFPMSGRELADRAGRFIAGLQDSELAEIISLGRDDMRPSALAGHMNPLLDWHFADS